MDDGASPPAEIHRHEGNAGSWESAQRPPSPPLARVVRRYLGYDERLSAPVRRQELPSATVTLIVNLGSPLTVEHPLGVITVVPPGGGFVSGLHETYAVTETGGAQAGVEVRLDPLGARRLLGWPAAELAHRVVDLVDLVGPAAAELAGRLAEAPGWDDRLARLDRFFAARLRPAPPAPVLAAAWAELTRCGGAAKVGALAEDLGCSRGYLATRFREEVGLPPKAVARLLRFRRAVAALDGVDPPDLARLAADCGYYDQAHLGNEFKRLAGASPGEYRRRRLGAGGLAADPAFA